MTRYELLLRFADDSRTHRDHAFTLHVLTEMWVASGKPTTFTPDFQAVLRLVRTSRRNLFRWMAELETFGFISYQRGKNQHDKSAISFTGCVQYGTPDAPVVSDMAQQQPAAGVQDGTAAGLPVSGMAQHDVSASIQHGTATKLPVSDMAQQNPGSVQNDTAEMPKTAQNRGFSELSTAATPDLPHVRDHHLINKLSINSKGDNQVVNDEKGVQGKKRKRTKRESPQAEKSTFANSAIADIARFREAFADDPTGKTADLDHYYSRLLNWRDKRGNVPERTDWISTARTFMLNDYREGKLVTHQTRPSYVSNTRNSRARIEPPGNRVFSW